MNEKDQILLNDYFNGLLADPDARAVRERAASDTEFGREFALRESMEAFPAREQQRAALKNTLSGIEGEFFREAGSMSARAGRFRLFAIAAGLALLIAALWFISLPGVPEYREYAQFSPLSLTVRGNTDQLKSDAEKAFNNGQYSLALAALDQLIAQDPSDIMLQEYKGICLLQTNHPAEARAVWEPIAAGASALRSEATWYIALSYLQEKNYPACKTTLERIEQGADWYREAQDLLKKLP